MRPEAIFLNGVFESCLENILEFQSELPEQILFMQPYSGAAIVHLREDPPSTDDAVRLLISTTTDLSTVRYVAEIVGWDDKSTLTEKKSNVLNRLIWTLLPKEGGLYDSSGTNSPPSINLLHVRRMKKLERPFSVTTLEKTSDGKPMSPDRSTAGGWSYVRNTFDS